MSLQTNPYSKYTTINVNYIVLVNEQKVNESRNQVTDRMQTCRHVATKLHFSNNYLNVHLGSRGGKENIKR